MKAKNHAPDFLGALFLHCIIKDTIVVEATRVELVSENRFLQLSTSVVYLFKFRTKAADKQAATVRSSNAIQRCEQAEESFTTALCRSTGRGTPVGDSS